MAITGQWIGTIQGDNSGLVLISIDADRPERGVVTIFESEGPVAQPYRIVFRLNQSPGSLEGTSGDICEVGQPIRIPRASPREDANYELPSFVSMQLRLEGERLLGRWQTNAGREGEITANARWIGPTPEDSKIVDWDGFKAWANERPRSSIAGPAFRGHADWRYELRTTFHRAGRACLDRYSSEDVPTLHSHIDSLTDIRFDLNNADEYLALLALGQHHGFPTPLLDWTESPYVAAFFAFSDLLSKPQAERAERVRVFCLDQDFVHEQQGRDLSFQNPLPHVTVLRPLARRNPRILAQQGLFTFSNLGDAYSWIRHLEQKNNKSYMSHVDISASEAYKVLDDLAYMGITAASMFPGLDGICRALNFRLFSSAAQRTKSSD